MGAGTAANTITYTKSPEHTLCFVHTKQPEQKHENRSNNAAEMYRKIAKQNLDT